MKSHWRMVVFAFFALLLLGAYSAMAGQIDARTLRSQEKKAFEAGDALMDGLTTAAGRDITCENCLQLFRQTLDAVADMRAQHRADVFAIEANNANAKQKKVNLRHDMAVSTATRYAELQQGVSDWSGSLCGQCVPGRGGDRQAAMQKEFGDSRASIILSALADSLGKLRKASTALQRRFYAPTFGTAVDMTFEKWMAKPTGDNIEFAASCIDGMLVSLTLKSLAPANHIFDPLKSKDPEIVTWGNEPNTAAFALVDTDEMFLNPGFFWPGGPSIIIHEESHLLYNATDRGVHRYRRRGTVPPRNKGTSTLLDAYSITSLVDELAKM